MGHDEAMGERRGSSIQLALAGLCAAGFTLAIAALVTSQLALMSVLDTTRAERAAEQIATSRFTADVIGQTVERAVAPIAGREIAVQLATATSNDPQVTGVVETALIAAHRQVVDPDVSATQLVDGNAAVDSAIVQSVVDSASAAGFDLESLGLGDASLASLQLDAVAAQAGLPSVVPDDVPNLGLRQVAETTRIIALLAMFVFGFIAVIAHPRPGRGARRLGLSVAIVCGAWLVGLVIAGWIIGLVANTLFGEMLQTVWTDAVPTMLLLVGAGVLIGAGVAVAGIALDGFDRQRAARSAY